MVWFSKAVVTVLIATAAAPVFAQSLADVARREEERRTTIAAPGKLYTNESLRAEPAPAPAAPPQSGAPAPAGMPPAGAQAPQPPGPLPGAQAPQPPGPPAGAQAPQPPGPPAGAQAPQPPGPLPGAQAPQPPGPPAGAQAPQLPGPPAAGGPAAGQPAAGQPAPAPPAAAPPAAPVPAAPAAQGEAEWRKRIAGARDALTRSQMFAEALQSRINALSTDFVNRDDPVQRDLIAAERQKALIELDRVRRELQDQQKAIAAIQEDARKAGVPAGWVR